MKVLITGATGFVGQNFIPALIKKSPQISIMTVSRSVEKAQQLFPDSHCQHISTGQLKQIVEYNPDVIFHLATLSTSRNDEDIISSMIDANITFGVNLLHYLSLCKNIKLFVNIGTFAQYRLGTQTVSDAYLYSASKTAFRQFVNYYSHLYNFKYVHLVPYTIYGGKSESKKLIDYIIESVHSEKAVDMTKGEQVLDFVHVDDVVSFFIFLIENISLFRFINNGEEFHIGTGIGTRVRDLASLVEKTFNAKCNINWGGRPYREMDTMYSVAPIAKNLEILKWKASISIEEGLQIIKRNIIE